MAKLKFACHLIQSASAEKRDSEKVLGQVAEAGIKAGSRLSWIAPTHPSQRPRRLRPTASICASLATELHS